ncbi:MAG: hypothetical protein V4722_04145 [Bacteroidota bacterium]
MPLTRELLNDFIDQLDENQQESLLTFLKSVIPLAGRVTDEQYSKEFPEGEADLEQDHLTIVGETEEPKK